MAIAGDRIRFKFQDPREQPNRLAERFYGRVAYPDVRNPQQKALEYNRDLEQNEAKTTNQVYNQQIYADIQRRIKNALEQKERFLNEIKYAPNFEQADFYKKQIQILDNLINDLNLDLQRSALSAEYINTVKDMDAKEIADTRKLEIVKNIFGKPPAIAPELANKIKSNLKLGGLDLELVEEDINERRRLKKNTAQQTIAGAMRQRLARNDFERQSKALDIISGAVRQTKAKKEIEKKKEEAQDERELIQRLEQQMEQRRFLEQFREPSPIMAQRPSRKKSKKSKRK